MPIELNPSGPELNPDMLLGIAHGHTVLVPISALPGGTGISTVAAASDYNANVVTPIAAAAAAAAGANTNANGRVKLVGPYADAAALQAAYPAAANSGAVGLVGSAAPYARYSSDGSTWVAPSTGGGTPSTTTPNSLGATAAVGTSTAFMRADAVIALPTALQVGGFPQISGNYDASTNTVLTGPLTGQHLASSTVPAGGPPAFKVTVAGTPGLDAVGGLAVGDYLFQTGTVWDVAYGVSPTTAMKKGNGSGGLADAVLSVDYAAPISIQSALEVVMPSSGSIGNNGALTLTTALQNTLSDGCWMTFPVGAIAAGIPAAAGMKYWVAMSSTTVGVIYNNTYTPGTNLPTPPTTPTAFVTTGPGAFTQVTGTDVTAYSVTIPANTLGPNGSIDIELWGRANNSAGTKAIRCFLGGQNLGPTINLTTGQQQSMMSRIANKQNAKKQKNNASGRNVSGNSSTLFGTVDTTLAQTLVVNFNLAVNTDWVCLDEVRITINYGA
jgi:hypothetical protein